MRGRGTLVVAIVSSGVNRSMVAVEVGRCRCVVRTRYGKGKDNQHESFTKENKERDLLALSLLYYSRATRES